MDVRTETKIFKFGDLYNSTERQEKGKRRDILSRKFSILFIPSHWDKYIVGSNVTQFLKKKKDMFHVTFYFSSAGPLLPFYWRFPCVWYWKILSIIGPLLPWDQDWLVIGVWRLRHARNTLSHLEHLISDKDKDKEKDKDKDTEKIKKMSEGRGVS